MTQEEWKGSSIRFEVRHESNYYRGVILRTDKNGRVKETILQLNITEQEAMEYGEAYMRNGLKANGVTYFR